jgi:hypothetical protein
MMNGKGKERSNYIAKVAITRKRFLLEEVEIEKNMNPLLSISHENVIE